MKLMKTLAGSMLAISLIAAPAAFSAEPMHKMGSNKMGSEKMMNMDAFMKSCDMDHDGMMSKAEMLKHMEKMFDQMDTKKTGKLDTAQTREFLKQFTAPSGG